MRRGKSDAVGASPSAKEYIDDLPVYPDTQADASSEMPGPSGYTADQQRVVSGPGCMVVLLCAVALIVVGWATAALQYTVGSVRPNTSQSDQKELEPAPAVTVTKTKIELPASCKQALLDFEKYLDAAYVISGVNNQQLDLMDEANQAILSRDWKGLAALTERQRKLERELGPASTKVLPVLIQVKEGLKQCQLDAS